MSYDHDPRSAFYSVFKMEHDLLSTDPCHDKLMNIDFDIAHP